MESIVGTTKIVADTIKAKVKNSRLTMDITGNLDGGICEIFCMVSTEARRDAIIKTLNEANARMTEREQSKVEG